MERLTKLTPRTKDSQVAPEASSWSDNVPADPKPAAQSASVAPAPDDAKGPYSAEVERQVRFSGRAAAKESVLLYLKLLVPMTIVSLWMFTMYSVISWVVPNVLCSDVSKELSVR